MTREEAIDKLMQKLGGKKVINVEEINQQIDFEEVSDLLAVMFALVSNMYVNADIYALGFDDADAKYFCSHTSKGLVLLGRMLNRLSIEIMGEKITKDVIDSSIKLQEGLYSIVKKEAKGDAHDLN